MSARRLAALLVSMMAGAAAIAVPIRAQDMAQKPLADLSAIPPVSNAYHPSRTPWGEPDFRGGWPIDHLNGTPMQRDPKQGDRMFLTDAEFAERTKQIEARAGRLQAEDKSDKLGQGHWTEMGVPSRRTSLLILPRDGRLPEMTAEGKRRSGLMRSSWRKGQTYDGPDDFDSWDHCITRGLPASMLPMMYNNGIRIWQSPGLVAIQLEMIHETRMVPTGGSAPIPSAVHHYMGSSRGHWENGNTLVIETSNFKPGPSATNIVTSGAPPWNDTPVSTSAKMVERLTMTGPNSIVYDMTWTDPVIFTSPWTVRLDWRRNDPYGMFEYACHEGDVQIRNYITASRAQRAKEKEANQ